MNMLNSRLNSWLFSRLTLLLPAVLFGLWGGVIFRLQTSGLLAELQNTTYHPFSISAAIVCWLLALSYPLLIEPTARPARCRWRSLTLAILPLAAPVALFVTLPRDHPTAGFLARRYAPATDGMNIYQLLGIDQSALRQDLRLRQAQANRHPVKLNLLELNLIVSAPDLRQVYDQAEVSLTGQWLAATDGSVKSFRLAQMIMFCCAADARVLGLDVTGEAIGARDGDRLEVTGILCFETTGVPRLLLRQSRLQNF
ncbi:MAG: hypothetical protein LBK76_09760 [Verrucomicrobiales bacterium]|nr:hypothetical protein [Verrucomicrobiales bacterium]